MIVCCGHVLLTSLTLLAGFFADPFQTLLLAAYHGSEHRRVPGTMTSCVNVVAGKFGPQRPCHVVLRGELCRGAFSCGARL